MMQTVYETVHHCPREEFEVVDPGEYPGVEKLRVLHIPDFG
jgi:hypothetical protein